MVVYELNGKEVGGFSRRTDRKFRSVDQRYSEKFDDSQGFGYGILTTLVP